MVSSEMGQENTVYQFRSSSSSDKNISSLPQNKMRDDPSPLLLHSSGHVVFAGDQPATGTPPTIHKWCLLCSPPAIWPRIGIIIPIDIAPEECVPFSPTHSLTWGWGERRQEWFWDCAKIILDLNLRGRCLSPPCLLLALVGWSSRLLLLLRSMVKYVATLWLDLSECCTSYLLLWCCLLSVCATVSVSAVWLTVGLSPPLVDLQLGLAVVDKSHCHNIIISTGRVNGFLSKSGSVGGGGSWWWLWWVLHLHWFISYANTEEPMDPLSELFIRCWL